MSQINKERSKAAETQDETVAQHLGQTARGAEERQTKLTEDVDAILDEIDGVLETNAEVFVKAFVQKGGE